MSPKKDPAKELFFKYSCNHFFMMKEGEDKLYAELGGGGKEKEAQWRKEYIDHWISEINTNDTNPLWRIMNAWAWEAILAILAMEDYGDDYMKFWFDFTLERISDGRYMDRKLRKAALQKARALWIEILKQPEGITEEHKKEIGNAGRISFQATSPEDYILK